MSQSPDPEALKRKPPRPIQEIAADILRFPLGLAEGEAFDSSKRVTGNSGVESHFGDYLKDHSRTAGEDAALEGTPSLLDRLIAGKIPKKPRELPQTPQLILAHSTVAMEKLHGALAHMAQTGQAGATEKAVIQKAAYPLAELLAQADEQRASDLTGNLKPLADALGIKDDDEAVVHFKLTAHNLRHHVLPLMEELGAALNLTLSKTLEKK